MLNINALNIEKLPFIDLNIINSLIDFEGIPTLLHFRDSRQSDILAYWVDFDQNNSRWIYARISKRELFEFLSGYKTLKSLFEEISSDYIFLYDVDANENQQSVILIDSRSIPSQYFPKDDSYFKLGLSDFYKEYLREFTYINRLRENSYILKVEPSDKRHQNTVGAKQAGLVLQGATNSMEGYVQVIAFNRLTKQYSDGRKINRRVNKMKKQFSPRITNSQMNSFEVWLAMDTLTFNEAEDSIDSDIRNEIVDGYKRDVLDIDYTSEDDARLVAEKFNEDEREMIFKPLINIFENSDLVISISDFKKSINKTNRKIKFKTSFKEILFPPPTLEQVTEELNRKQHLISLVLSLPEDEDFTKINKKQLADGLLFSEKKDETPYTIKPPILLNGDELQLKTPLICILRIKENDNFQLSLSSLELVATGTDLAKTTESIKQQFAELAQAFLTIPNWPDPRAEEIKKYLDGRV